MEGSSRESPERSTLGTWKAYSNVRNLRRRSARASGGKAAKVVGLRALAVEVEVALVQSRAAWSEADRCHWARRCFCHARWLGQAMWSICVEPCLLSCVLWVWVMGSSCGGAGG